MNHGREALSWPADVWSSLAQAVHGETDRMGIMPADRLRPLVERGLYGSAALAELSGLVLSLGGGAIDLVVGVEPAVAFLRVDSDALFRFRVFERFALRLKDDRSLVRLEFVH